MKTLTVKKLDVVSVGNFAAMLGAVLSFVWVLIAWIMAMVDYAQLEVFFPNAVEWNTGFGLLAIIIIPAIYAAVWWVGGAIVAWFYNVALGASNGIKVDVEE